MKDLRQSREWANYLELIGWKIENIDNTNIFLKKLPLLGWYTKLQRPTKISSETVNFIEYKYHPFQFSIEPLPDNQSKLLERLKFKNSNSPSLPTKTLVIDLSKSESDLLKSFSPKTRYNIKLSQKKNLELIKSNNILDFTNFWRANFESKRFPFFSQQKNIINMHKAFSKKSYILLAQKDNEIVAGLFILLHDKVTYYMYAASNDIGRSSYAPTFLTWNAILLAKKSGYKIFDFDGIYDERYPIKTWLGFTKFKQGFGRKEIKYPGSFVKTRSIIKI